MGVTIDVAGPSRHALKGGDFDCIDIPDAAMTLAVVGAMATSPVKIRNVGSWRVKETERMKAIVTELQKLGVEASPPSVLKRDQNFGVEKVKFSRDSKGL